MLNRKTQDMEWKSIGQGQAQHGVKLLTEDETGPAHACDVELTPTGPTLVNGQDLERLVADE